MWREWDGSGYLNLADLQNRLGVLCYAKRLATPQVYVFSGGGAQRFVPFLFVLFENSQQSLVISPAWKSISRCPRECPASRLF